MVVLGMHGHWMKGIDYMGVKYRNKVKLVEWIFILELQIYNIRSSNL
jgi:hypothetical protein